MTLKNNRAPFLCCFKLCWSFQSHGWIQTGVKVRKRPIWVKINDFFLAVWPWNVMDDLEKLKGPTPKQHQALCIISPPYVNSNWSYSPETPNLGQNRWFLSRMTLKFDRWPWKTIGHLFYAASSFVHNLIAISEFKLELQNGNAQFGLKLTIFFSHLTLKFGSRPCKTIGHLS